MQSFLPGRVSRSSGSHLFVGLFITGILGVLVACGTEDPAPGAITTDDSLDASVRDLPGDGLEPTPEANISGPRGPRPELIDALGSRNPRPDAGAAPPADAGVDASDASGPL